MSPPRALPSNTSLPTEILSPLLAVEQQLLSSPQSESTDTCGKGEILEQRGKDVFTFQATGRSKRRRMGDPLNLTKGTRYPKRKSRIHQAKETNLTSPPKTQGPRNSLPPQPVTGMSPGEEKLSGLKRGDKKHRERNTINVCTPRNTTKTSKSL